jgi:hypothetical protein
MTLLKSCVLGLVSGAAKLESKEYRENVVRVLRSFADDVKPILAEIDSATSDSIKVTVNVLQAL